MRLLDPSPGPISFAGSAFPARRTTQKCVVPSVAASDMRAHIAFLREVHVHSTRDGSSSLYVDAPPLRAAVDDYLAWLVEAATPGGPWSSRPGRSPGETEVTRAPSLRVAWCWHVHRLHPHAYVRDCASLAGAVPYPAAGVGFAHAAEPSSPSGLGSPAPARASNRASIASGLADRLVPAVERHAPFLWQVSGAAYNDDAFLLAAAARYEAFVAMTVDAGGAMLAPPIDVDLAWHTHMLRDAEYLREGSAMRGPALGAMGHDNGEGMGARGDTSRLEVPWANTLRAYGERVSREETKKLAAEAVPTDATEVSDERVSKMKSAFESAVPRGARHRGYAPDWWFARGESVVVVDDFLSPAECEAIVSQMPGPESAMNCPSGKKAQMYVDGDAEIETRIRRSVSVGLGFAGEPEASASSLVLEEIVNRETGENGSRRDQFDPHRSLTVERSAGAVKLPARVSVGTMHPHRDRLAIYTLEGETMFEDDTLTADGYTCVVYLKADGGTLVLEPDENPGSGDASWTPPSANLRRREIDVVPGRLVAWPNHAFKHCAGRRDDVVEGADAVAESRWLLGPFHFTPGRARLPQVGDCGSASCGSSETQPPPAFELADIWPDHEAEWSFTPPEPLSMRRSDEAFHEKVHADLNRFAGTYKAVFEKREISLGDEPFEFFGLCFFPFICIPFIGCPRVKVSPTYLDSYTITIRKNKKKNKYEEEVKYQKWKSFYFGACACSGATGRERVGEIDYTGLVGEAKDDMCKSIVHLTLVEANENELRYRRKGKDATGVYDAKGSYAAHLARDSQSDDPELIDIFQEWLKDHEKRPFWNCDDLDVVPPDTRILDIDGEMVVRDGEIVLTESVDGREPFTITLKKQEKAGKSSERCITGVRQHQ